MTRESSFPEKEAEPKIPDLHFSTSSEQKRGQIRNQDAVLIASDKKLAAVFDGMGGTKGADVAASTALTAVKRSIDQGEDTTPSAAHALEQLIGYIENGHRAILDHRRNSPEHDDMGSTAAAVRIFDNPDGTRELLVANSGDSRVYVLRGDGTLEHITQPTADDTTSQSVMRKELAIYDDASTNNDMDNYYMAQYYFKTRHSLETFLGAEKLRIDRYRVPLSSDDRVVLMTDGIPNNLTTSEIARILSGSGTSEEHASALIAAAKDRALVHKTFRSHDDDMSIVIIDQ